VATITLPDSPLSKSKASKFSSDGKWLAVSGESRGAVWNLESGDRVFFTHGFDGALFEHDRIVAKFAKRPPEPSRVFTLDPASKGVTKLYDVPNDSESQSYLSSQMGDLLMIVRPRKDSKDPFSGSSTLEVHDVRNNKTLWEHKLEKGRPGLFYNGKVLTLLIASWDGIRAAAKEDPTLSNRLSMVDAKRDAYAIQVLDAASGQLLGSVLVDTGKLSFKVRSAYTFGDSVYVGDSLNRTLVYSLKTGLQKGIVLGHVVTASSGGETVVIENEEGVADLYDAASLQSLAHLSFPSRIAEATFTVDGILLVLTADQTVYQLKPSAESRTQAVR
jgi:WD40 repeat protein